MTTRGKQYHTLEGKNITLWKKNITRDEITPSTKGSMFIINILE
jgi:hypothetical protein